MTDFTLSDTTDSLLMAGLKQGTINTEITYLSKPERNKRKVCGKVSIFRLRTELSQARCNGLKTRRHP